ncbi:MAG: SUF system NifU family Fe-S cluster assembly protein [Gammaproteobacteria bacterium]|nr:MAG: SUF system NifU family Fe-S cluster assembly protein [Gammaproteobacteria bacterium]RTZ62041.1 MAG: SUF system NifU family Fe-S cluster assembly protein [Gammaproteobacteria bacterium]
MNDLRDLYEEVILDHNRNPRNFQKNPPDANRHAHGHNPLCGDDFTVHLTVKDDKIVDVGFEGVGCAISTASASLMTEAIMGKTVEEAKQIFGNVHHMLTEQGEDADTSTDVGKLAVLSGVKEYPMRVKCATLAWHVMDAALENRDDVVTTE